MVRVQVRKVSNPSDKPRKKVKLTEEQIRHFGTKRQKAALARKRATARASSSHRPRTAKRSTSNPAWLVTLGPAVNPHKERSMPATKTKKRKKVSATRKKTRRVVAKSNPKRKKNAVRTRTKTVVKYKYRKSNPKVVVRYRTKKRNSRKRHTTRKNPDIFGARLGSKDSLKMIGGGVVGVAVVKIVPTLLPAGTIASIASSSFGKIAVAGATAVIAGWGAGKLDKRFGEGVMFGGLMMAAAVVINVVSPSLYSQYIGMGDFVPGRFAVPQNPVRAALPSAAPAQPAASGAAMKSSRLGAAYHPAY